MVKEQYKGNFVTEDELKYAFDEYYVQKQKSKGKTESDSGIAEVEEI